MQKELIAVRVNETGLLIAITPSVVMANQLPGELYAAGFHLMVRRFDIIRSENQAACCTNAWVAGSRSKKGYFGRPVNGRCAARYNPDEMLLLILEFSSFYKSQFVSIKIQRSLDITDVQSNHL